MDMVDFLRFLHDAEGLKRETRHSWLSDGRQESVAEHTWRLGLMAFVLEEEFSELDTNKIIKMLLIHDLSEAYVGDIPTFNKTEEDNAKEKLEIRKIVKPLPLILQEKILSLWDEFENQQTPESRVARALDKIEVLIQHNEADLSTWEPHEYDLNFGYAEEESKAHPVLRKLLMIVREEMKKKINSEK